MPQMVLPQTPAPGMQKDASTAKSGSGREPDGESRYESVSRAEQKRVDRQKTERRDEARPPENRRDTAAPDDKNSSATASSDKPTSQSKAENGSDTADTGSADVTGTADQVSSEAVDQMDVTSTPLTFAELQALLVPGAAASGTTTATTTAKMPESLTPLMPANGSLNGALNGVISGKPGQPAQGTPGLSPGLQLTEAMTAVLGSESAKPAEPTSLVASGRFQSALEVAGQQTANANAAKLSADAAVPLKSYATSIDTPVGNAEWGDKLVGKLSWLTARNMSVAEIHLTPPDMGPMEVKVRVQNDQANITVHSANPVVRDQLEQNSQRLRDMLGEQGLNLSRFDVSDSPQQRGGEQGPGEDQGRSSGGNSDTLAEVDANDADMQAGSLDLSWKGEVDIFA